VSSLVRPKRGTEEVLFVPCRCRLLALLGLSVTSDLSPQRVEQRTSPAAFDVAGLLVASSAMALNYAIICAGLTGGIG
jgi:hypothetical protein